MHNFSFLQDLLVLFGMGVLTVVLFHRLNLPPVLGFLVTGVICGPFGFRLIDDGQSIEALAEIGLVLLLFTIGIEFSVQTFLRIKKFLLIAGGLQVVVTTAIVALISHYLSMPIGVSIFLGMLVALSSTAIVVRILDYRGELDSAQGRSSISIMIFQDLCIVPMVLAVPFLAGTGGSFLAVAAVSGKAILFLLLAGTIARFMVPWLLSQVAKTKKREAFVLSIILLCLGTATATSHFGLSMALGAFIAGLIISESKYSHQALGEILPFREVFNCLVFVSIGMLFDVRILLSNPFLVLGCLAAVMVVKASITTTITKLMGHSLQVALLTGLALAQVSEFSFVLAKLGANSGLIDHHLSQLFLAVAILSMFATPAAIAGGEYLAKFLQTVLPDQLTRATSGGNLPEESEKYRDHVIIAGFAIAGRTVADSLTKLKIPHVIFDHDPVVVRAERLKGRPIFYGDAAQQEILLHAGLTRAKAIILTQSDAVSTVRAAEIARRLNPGIHVIARARHEDDMEALAKVGAQEVVPEDYVGALEILTRVLQHYMLTREEIETQLGGLKKRHNERLQSMLLTHRPWDFAPSLPSELSVETRIVLPNSSLIGKTLAQAGISARSGASVVALHRQDGSLVFQPEDDVLIQDGDSLILLGKSEQLKAAGNFFALPDPPKPVDREPKPEGDPPPAMDQVSGEGQSPGPQSVSPERSIPDPVPPPIEAEKGPEAPPTPPKGPTAPTGDRSGEEEEPKN